MYSSLWFHVTVHSNYFCYCSIVMLHVQDHYERELGLIKIFIFEHTSIFSLAYGCSKALKSHGISRSGSHVIELEN